MNGCFFFVCILSWFGICILVKYLQIGLVWSLQMAFVLVWFGIGLVYCLQIGLAGKLRGLLVIEGLESHCKVACKCQTSCQRKPETTGENLRKEVFL